jgi:S1-C subfamily serine protease
MTLTPRLAELQARAERWVVHDDRSQLVARVRAIVGPSGDELATRGGAAQLAADALAALKQAQTPTPVQLAALETMIRIMRPCPRCMNGELEPLAPESEPDFPLWPAFREKVQPFLRSVGRINDSGGNGIGTGFLVRENVLATNHHVLIALSHGTDVLQRGQATVLFVHELNTPDEPAVDITSVLAVHPTLDAVLLKVEAPAARAPLNINVAPAAEGEPVAAIGYPFKDPIRNPLFADAIFGDQYGVKRAAPGEVIGIAPAAVYHDCSTLGGNSGSPILSLADATVVGLHRDGYFTYRNEAVDGPALDAFVKSAAT